MLSCPKSSRLGGGGSPGTAGRAQAAAPAQFELTASKAPPAWLGAQHRSREGEQEDGGRAHLARGSGNRAGEGPPGGSTKPLSKSSLRASLGSPDRP